MTLLERMFSVVPETESPADSVPETALRVIESGADYGRFALEALTRGKGTTIGNSLRRTLLGAMPGYAVTWVRINRAAHEYATLDGMREDVSELLLNLKGVRIRSLADREGRLRIEAEGLGQVRAGDILATSDFKIVNPEHHLATLDSQSSQLSVEMNVEQGFGYQPARDIDSLPAGTLAIDAVFTPVRKVNFSVEPMRAGSHDDLERLVVEVWTDETVAPLDVLRSAADQLMQDIHLVATASTEKKTSGPVIRGVAPEKLNMRVEDLGLRAGVRNSLRRAGLNRVVEVLLTPDSELMKIRNFGKTSLAHLKERFAELGIVPEDVEVEMPDRIDCMSFEPYPGG